MTKLEKLKKIQDAYYALIPCLKGSVVQDYALVLTDAPAYLKELIAEEEKKSDGKELEVGGKMKYHGWLIVREEEYVFLVFTPDNVDYPERGYEDWETDSLAEAKDWIDNYDTEECED